MVGDRIDIALGCFQGHAKALDSAIDWFVPALDEPVRVGDDDASGRELEVDAGPGDAGHADRRLRRYADLRGSAVRRSHEHRGMPGRRVVRPPLRWIDLQAGRGGHPHLVRVVPDHVGDRPKHLGDFEAGPQQCRDRGSQLRHVRDSLDPVTRDVTDHDAHRGSRVERVVPVATHADICGGGLVAAGQVQPVDGRERRERAGLELNDDLVFARVEPSAFRGLLAEVPDGAELRGEHDVEVDLGRPRNDQHAGEIAANPGHRKQRDGVEVALEQGVTQFWELLE